MGGIERHQAFAALIGLAAALFVMAGLPGRWRTQLRAAAVAVFVLALLAVLVEIALWWAGSGG